MPATEQTWRDTKLLHVVFAVSSVLMLITTVWMLSDDHRREWKQYQREFRNVESWAAQARIRQQENREFLRKQSALEKQLAAAQMEVPPKSSLDAFQAELNRDAQERKQPKPNFSAAQSNYDALAGASKEDRPPLRADLLTELDRYVRLARFREDDLLRRKKFRNADLDMVRSQVDIAIGEGQRQAKIDQTQAQVDRLKSEVDELNDQVQDATTHRKKLEEIVGAITKTETAKKKDLDEHKQTITLLEKAYAERERSAGEKLIELPIIDAFGRPLKVEQIWLPKLTLNNNFRDVARFDRCTTCHQGIDKTAPGSAVEPAYPPQHPLRLTLPTPEIAPRVKRDADYNDRLDSIYGLQLADHGFIKPDDVAVSVVRPQSPAAKAGLMPGDVLVSVKDVQILQLQDAVTYLVDRVEWGKPIDVAVRRGVPQPYTSHPRLDLFVGSISPHKMGEIGCTICHEGQGSATDFKWASHTPNDPRQAAEWGRDHGWFNNHHWIFPMRPRRTMESSCLKCHHTVTELEPSQRFPDPPAPKLVEGYSLIRQYGCYGCHEINGYDGPNRRIGPDMRTEPNYSAAAQALLALKGLDPSQREWAGVVAMQPDDDAARRRLRDSLRQAASATKPAASADADGGNVAATPDKPQAKLPAEIARLTNLLDDVETPGTLRKVGPSLRRVSHKLDYDFLYAWIRKPSDFRPDTKMPQFFGLNDHLVDHSQKGKENGGEDLRKTQEFERIEIRGVVEYLLGKSQPFEYAKASGAGAADASLERGKKLFQVRGCLACHKHSDVPGSTMRQGPDLSRLGAKLKTAGDANGPEWLYTWLRNPNSYHPRTLMPNTFLDPVRGADGTTTDPARDIATYLLSFQDWKPQDVPARELSDEDKKSLSELALLHLKDKFSKRQAADYLKTGIPASRAGEVKGDEVELLGQMSDHKQLRYIGRRTITKYGCSACHDIPGFEDAKPIGTGLADWGRKTPDRLAFEMVQQYILHGHTPPPARGHSESGAGAQAAPTAAEQYPLGQHAQDPTGAKGHATEPSPPAAHEAAEGGHDVKFEEMDPGDGYYLKALFGHEREGFIWQKLRDPRSFDYEKTRNKGYNERLRMPKFTDFDNAQREAIITFVLGLVAEPPVPQYVYKPAPQQEAIARGKEVIEKFNCTGCHALDVENWKLAFDPGTFDEPAEIVDYDFLLPHVSPQQVEASKKIDVRGMQHARLVGMPAANPETGQPQVLDEDGAPIEKGDTESKPHYRFVPWDHALVGGNVYQAGLQSLFVPLSTIDKRYEQQGGYLARLLYPIVLADERKTNPGVNADEAWGWVPPPLVHEGNKVQSDWLHGFLLDPYPIRPAVLLRMPKFNMSSEEASSLVSYFAAVDGAEFPYNFDRRTRAAYLAEKEASHPDRMAAALRIITDNNYCIKCHPIGDYNPTGSERAKGPQLDQVYRRFRADYLMRWIANPKRLLPYTGMPVNIPPNTGVSQELFRGSSIEQLEGVVDFLLNYDQFTERNTPIKRLIRPPTAPAQTGAAAPSAARPRASPQ